MGKLDRLKTVRIAGVEYDVVFDGRQELLDDYPRPSSLSNIVPEGLEEVRQRLKGQRVDGGGYRARSVTYDKAKAELKARGW